MTISKEWLIKSGDQVLGPFSTETVTEKILSREVVVLDECTRAEGRWRLIRDEPTFAHVVEEARKNLMAGREETEVGAFEATQISFSAEPGAVKEAEFVDQIDSNRSARQAPEAYKQFGLKSGVRPAPAGMTPQSVVMWVIAIGVVAFAAYMVFNIRKPVGERGVATLDFDRAIANADSAWQRGDFPQAEKLYAQVNRQRPLKLEVVSRLAPLMIQLEGQTVEAKRLLTDTARTNASGDPRLLADIQLGLGLAALYSQDDAAAEAIFKSAKIQGSQRSIADFNLGTLAFRKGQYEMASDFFTRASGLSLGQLMKVRALMSLPKKRGGRKEAAALLLGLSRNHFDSYQEAQLLSAVLLLESGNKKGALDRAEMVVNADPELTDEHWHEPLLYSDVLGWKALLPLCQKLHEGLNTESTHALLALCLAKAGRGEEALRELNEALGSRGGDPTLQAVQAQLLYESHRDGDAVAALEMAFQAVSPPRLARLVKARICARRGDLACAEREWKSLEKSNPHRLAAMIGLAQLDEDRGDPQAAREKALRALELSPQYKPALRLSGAGR